MRIIMIAVLILTGSPVLASADYFDGNDLIKLMESAQTTELGMYRGYVAGVQDSYNGVHFCVPEHVRLSQASEIIARYIKADPKRWHQEAKILAIEAFNEAFPCKK